MTDGKVAGANRLPIVRDCIEIKVQATMPLGVGCKK